MATTLTITNPKSLGLDYKTQFLGENLRYRVIKTVNVSGYLLNLTNDSGSKDILKDLETELKNSIDNWLTVIVNDYNMQTGILKSISFSSDVDVKKKEYSASFEFYEDGDLTGKLPAEYSLTSFSFISAISEDFTTEQQTSGNKSCTHKLSITAMDDSSGQSGITIAKALASALLADAPNTAESFSLSPTMLLWGAPTDSANVFYTESYNTITNECVFSKKYEIDSVLGSNAYVKKLSHSFSFGGSGITTVEEKAEYKTKREAFAATFNAMKSDMVNAFTRCNAIYSEYAQFADTSGAALVNRFFEKKITKAEADGSCSYTVSFSNDKFYSLIYEEEAPLGNSFWSCTHDASYSQSSLAVTESGEIIGLDILGPKKVGAANVYWKNSVKGQIYGRLQTFFNSIKGKFPSLECGDSSIFLESQSVTKNNRTGKISYEVSYIADPSRVPPESNDGVKKITKSYTSQAGEDITLSSNFLVSNGREIKQISQNTKEESIESSVTIYGSDNMLFETYRTKADSEHGTLDGIVISASYEYDEFSNKFTSSLGTTVVKCS